MENKNLLKINQAKEVENKKVLFPHKGLNIALGVFGGIAVVAIIGLSIWANM